MRFRTTFASVLLAAFALGLLCLPVPALAADMPDFPQDFPQGFPQERLEEAGAAAAGMGCACMIAMLVCFLVSLAIWVAICVYVYRDATARGMENAALWLIIVILTGLIGLIVYLIVRPAKPGA